MKLQEYLERYEEAYGAIELITVSEEKANEWPYNLFFAIYPEGKETNTCPKWLNTKSISKVLEQMKERDARILLKYYGEHKNLKAIATEMNITYSYLYSLMGPIKRKNSSFSKWKYCFYSPSYLKTLADYTKVIDTDNYVKNLLYSGKINEMTIYDLSTDILKLTPMQRIRLKRDSIADIGHLADSILIKAGYEEFKTILTRPIFRVGYGYDDFIKRSFQVFQEPENKNEDMKREDKVSNLISALYVDDDGQVSKTLYRMYGVYNITQLSKITRDNILSLPRCHQKRKEKFIHILEIAGILNKDAGLDEEYLIQNKIDFKVTSFRLNLKNLSENVCPIKNKEIESLVSTFSKQLNSREDCEKETSRKLENGLQFVYKMNPKKVIESDSETGEVYFLSPLSGEYVRWWYSYEKEVEKYLNGDILYAVTLCVEGKYNELVGIYEDEETAASVCRKERNDQNNIQIVHIRKNVYYSRGNRMRFGNMIVE